MKFRFLILIVSLMIFSASCSNSEEKADAYGNFEADEWIIYPETPGKLITFAVEEGDQIKKGQLIGQVDTTTAHLQINQLKASISAIYAKKQTARPEIDLLLKRKEVLMSEQQRVTRLLADQVATQKQMDDINHQVTIIDQQMATAEEKVAIANTGLFAQVNPIRQQIKIVQEAIKKSAIFAPSSGRVSQKFTNAGEMVVPQIPLLKLAKLDTVFLRVYFTGDQLAAIQLDQMVNIKIDGAQDATYEGRITWIADEAEFTPKIIQTKEERVNLVYAAKVAVANDGVFKMGMPGEVWLQSTDNQDNK